MSKQTIQVVAYRRASLTDDIDKTKPYYLDIENAPSIQVNYNFEDVKKPDTRKTDFSQKFKLPMTDNNNQFFEHWYNVNIDKLIYSQNQEIEAHIIVNGNTILSGNLKLMGFYKKAGYYDCVVLGKISTLFTQIGNKTVREAFHIIDQTTGSFQEIDPELLHVWNKENFEKSWDGTDNTFLNTSGTSLRDTVASVQKVIYPIQSIIMNRAVWASSDTANWLNNQFDMNDPQGGNRFYIDKLPPALQLRTILSNIFRKAGFYWESEFLDSVYFRRLFMTTMDYDTNIYRMPVAVPNNLYNGDAFKIAPLAGTTTGTPFVTNLYPQYSMFQDYDDYYLATDGSSVTGPAVTNGSWDMYYDGTNTDLYAFTPPSNALYQVTFRAYFDSPYTGEVNFLLGMYNTDTMFSEQTQVSTPVSLNNNVGEYIEVTLEITLGSQYSYVPVIGISSISGDTYVQMTFGSTTLVNGAKFECTVLPNFVGTTTYNSVIAPSEGIDPELKQSDFLKDIIQRFNLVVVNDSDDPSKLYIEPFKEFVGTGEILNWDNKIDTEKEEYLKPTSDLMTQEILFTDKESEDFYNKFIKENLPQNFVYGHYSRINTNIFAKKGKLSNNPVLAPYIVDRVNTAFGSGEYSTEIHNFLVHNRASYNDEGSEIMVKQPHKLFYYNGTPTQLDVSWYGATLEFINSTNFNQYNIEYDKYPLCTAYELSNTGLPNINIQSTRSLFWRYDRNAWIQKSSVWNGFAGTIQGTLYNEYYKEYLAEIYNENARLLEINIYLTPTDIFKFSWKNLIYLHQAYWRVIKIHNYQVGTETSTKVTLIKVPDLTGESCISDACGDVVVTTIPNNIIDSDIFSFDDGSGGVTQLTTFECCQCLGGYWINTGSTTAYCIQPGNSDSGGVGPVDDGQAGGFELAMMMIGTGGAPAPKMTGSGSKKIQTLHTANNMDSKSSKAFTTFNPLKSNKTTFNVIKIDKTGSVVSNTPTTTPVNKYLNVNSQTTEYSLANMGLNDTIYLKLDGNRKPIYIEQGTHTTVKLKLTSVVVDGSVDLGNSQCVEIDTAFKITTNNITQIGHAGGILHTAIYDTIATLNITPSIYYRSIGTGRPELEIRVRCTGGDSYTKINYTAELKLTSVSIMQSLGVMNSFDAIYQDGDEIAFEDNELLRYN
tara:strand:- start:1351 stop:4821 length:3471 start_codon:yes stop_codon:yes gene_type:complete